LLFAAGPKGYAPQSGPTRWVVQRMTPLNLLTV
jgi:hypothetical protein